MALTAKQEAFAQAIVSGMNQSDAYRHAYSTKGSAAAVNVDSCKLMANPKVALRVETLRKPVIAKLQYGVEQAMAEADRALAVAERKENGGAMVAAITLRSKLNGLIVEKRENRNTTLDDVPIDELVAADAAITAILNARSADGTGAKGKAVRSPARSR